MTGKETKTCFRSYTAWQYQEEVDWMNKMAAEGWALERTNGFVHHFSRCEPGAWIIRLDRPSFKMSSPEGQEYLAMLHDFGAEWVGGVNGWIYLRRRADQGIAGVFIQAFGVAVLPGAQNQSGCAQHIFFSFFA